MNATARKKVYGQIGQELVGLQDTLDGFIPDADQMELRARRKTLVDKINATLNRINEVNLFFLQFIY